MAIASGSRVQLRQVEEVTRGVTPGSPTLKVLRSTTRNINPEKDTLESEEVRSDRNIADVRHGFTRGMGPMGFELSVESYDDPIEYLLGGTWAAVATSGSPNLGVTAPSTFTRAAGSWVTDNFKIGDIIEASGFSNAENNGVFLVKTVNATSLVVEDTTLVNEAEAGSKDIVVKGKRISVGTNLKTVTMERAFLDIGKYQVFRGAAYNGMRLNISPERIVGGEFSLVSMIPDPMTGSPLDANPTAAPTTRPFAAFDGGVYIDSTRMGIVTAVELNIDNGRTLEGVVGSKYSPDVFEGLFNMTGQITLFMEDEALVNAFLNETAARLWVRMNDPAGNFHLLKVPDLLYTGAGIDPPRLGPNRIVLPFRAKYDATADTSFTWQRSNS